MKILRIHNDYLKLFPFLQKIDIAWIILKPYNVIPFQELVP